MYIFCVVHPKGQTLYSLKLPPCEKNPDSSAFHAAVHRQSSVHLIWSLVSKKILFSLLKVDKYFSFGE